jgi:hypothetical protein
MVPFSLSQRERAGVRGLRRYHHLPLAPLQQNGRAKAVPHLHLWVKVSFPRSARPYAVKDFHRGKSKP